MGHDVQAGAVEALKTQEDDRSGKKENGRPNLGGPS